MDYAYSNDHILFDSLGGGILGMTEQNANRYFRDGRKLDTSKIEYKILLHEMLNAKIRLFRLAKIIGVDHGTLAESMRGNRQWKLWEAVAIKEAIGSDLPLEELFKKG